MRNDISATTKTQLASGNSYKVKGYGIYIDNILAKNTNVEIQPWKAQQRQTSSTGGKKY